jgi:hypothetical protein
VGRQSGIRSAIDGMIGYVAGACLLLLLAVLGLLVVIQSPPDWLLWTGSRVVGHERGGIVFYSWARQHFTLDVPGFGAASHVVLYLDPAHPEHAVRDRLGTRVLDAVFTVLPLLLAVALLVVGASRRRARRRRRDAIARELGDDFVQRQLSQLRQGSRPPPSAG